ncbi:MAG: lysophospholipid acyltransferase family protein [Acidimicrobiales bacterium]
MSSVVRKTEFPIRAPRVPAGVDPVPATSKTGVDFDTDWARRPPARAARAVLVESVVRPVVAYLARPERSGQDRLDGLEGPVIFAANHHSHVDTPLLLTSIPLPWRRELVVGAAADYFFGTRVTSTLSALAIGAIPIERAKVGRKSSDLAASLVADGWSFMIFPEGGRSPDGWGQPFRGGAAYLAIKCEVPVVPVHLLGTGNILRKGHSRPNPSRTQVTFGSPLWPLEDESSRRFASRIEAAVSELADEAATDWWQARLRAHAGETPNLYGPEASSWRRQWALGDRRPSARRRRRRWPSL